VTFYGPDDEGLEIEETVEYLKQKASNAAFPRLVGKIYREALEQAGEDVFAAGMRQAFSYYLEDGVRTEIFGGKLPAVGDARVEQKPHLYCITIARINHRDMVDHLERSLSSLPVYPPLWVTRLMMRVVAGYDPTFDDLVDYDAQDGEEW
jgi:hypothetical protein